MFEAAVSVFATLAPRHWLSTHTHLTLLFCLFRLFLQELPEAFCSMYPARIRSRFDSSTLQQLTVLDNKDINWDKAKNLEKIENSDLPVTVRYTLPKKESVKQAFFLLTWTSTTQDVLHMCVEALTLQVPVPPLATV